MEFGVDKSDFLGVSGGIEGIKSVGCRPVSMTRRARTLRPTSLRRICGIWVHICAKAAPKKLKIVPTDPTGSKEVLGNQEIHIPSPEP